MINRSELSFLTKILTGYEIKKSAVFNNSGAPGSSSGEKLDEAKKLFAAETSEKNTATIEEQFAQIEKEILTIGIDGGEDALGKLIQAELKLMRMSSSLKTPEQEADSTALFGLCTLKMALVYSRKDDSENYLKSIKSAQKHFMSALREDYKNFRALYYSSMLFRVAGLAEDGKYFAEKCYEYHPAKFNAFRNLYLYNVNRETLDSNEFILKYIAEIEKFIEKNKDSADIDAYKELLYKYLKLIGNTEDKGQKAEYIKKAYKQGQKMMGLITSNTGKSQDQEAIQLFLVVFEEYKHVEYDEAMKRK